MMNAAKRYSAMLAAMPTASADKVPKNGLKPWLFRQLLVGAQDQAAGEGHHRAAERSVLPEIISIVMPQATMVTTAVWVKRLMMLVFDRNTGEMKAQTTTSRIQDREDADLVVDRRDLFRRGQFTARLIHLQVLLPRSA